MTLQNRVTPFGDIVADPARGLFMGNRCGRFHDNSQSLGKRHWRGRAWLICQLEFKGRHRKVMGDGYTELFFLDEATALAAGHRPCFECRRADANTFKAAWARGNGVGNDSVIPPSAPQMDVALHRSRGAVVGTNSLPVREAASLPDGAMVAVEDEAWLINKGWLWRWTTCGYDVKCPLSGSFRLLTPVATLGALNSGYRPHIHPSAIAIN